MIRTRNFFQQNVSLPSGTWLARRHLALPVCLLLGVAGLQAYPVTYAVTGTLGGVTSGADPLNLSNKPFNISGTVESTTLKLTGLSITVGKLVVNPSSVSISFTAGTPGSISVSATALGIPFNALVKVDLTSSTPYPFPSEAIAGGNVSYGESSNTTILAIATGNVTATGTPPAGSLTATPGALSFVFQTGGAKPSSQNVTIGSTASSPTSFTAAATTTAGGPWLSVAPQNGTTPATLTVSVDTTGLATGNYLGTITLTPTTEGASGTSLQVNLAVTAPTGILASPSTLTFLSGVGATAATTQLVNISSQTGVTHYTASAATQSGGTWLSVTPAGGAVPGTLRVSANPTGLSAGTYAGTVSVSPGGAQTPLIIPVDFTIGAAAGLTATPAALSFTSQLGAAGPGAQVLSVGGTNGLAFTTSSSSTSGGGWFSVSPATGTSPANITVSVNTAGLSAGSYAGSITFTPTAGGQASTVPVTLAITAAPALSTGKSALAFAFEAGATNPVSRTVTLGSSGTALNVNAAAFTNAGGAWLSASPSTSATPGSLTVTVNPAGLTQNIYTGAVSLSAPGASNGSSSIDVVLGISTGTAIVAAPNTLSFSAQVGGSSPAPTTVDLASTGGTINLTASSSVTSGGPWLSVTPASGAAPGTLTVSTDITGLAAGTYTGSVTLDYGGASPLVIPVSLAVLPPAPVIQAVTDAASLGTGALAPFSLISIWGTNLGPAAVTPLQLAGGSISTSLASTQVLVNGIPAPLLMVSAGQINAAIPGAIPAGSPATVQVIHQGVRSAAFTIQVANAAPGLFTAKSSGSGQGAILNQDLSANSSANPAAAGSIIMIFLDGAGSTTPLQADGSITTTVPSEIPKLNLPVSVQVGGMPADVLYSGPAPGALAGLSQVNARIPVGTAAGAVPVTVTVGTVTSQSGVTVAVK